MKIFLGDKYYKYDENNNLELVRVIRIKNENSFVCFKENSTETIRLNKNQISEYTRLKQDAFISFNIVELDNNLKDVMVAIHRTKDIENGIDLPYSVCRQSVTDLFANQVKELDPTTGQQIIYTGISVSVDTIPEDVPFQMMVACNNVNESILISTYMEDTLDIILSMVKQSKYDEVLKNLKQLIKQDNVRGYTESLRQLLEENNFMYDFHMGFRIYDIPYYMEYDENDAEVSPLIREYLEHILKVEMFKTYTIIYDKSINLEGAKRNHVLVSDLNNKLYIIAYDKGEYLNKYYRDQIKDKRDAVAMIKNKKY